MIVEYGLGLTDANSYVDLEFADDYFVARSNEVWQSLEDTDKEKALVLATDLIDSTYNWKGKKSTQEQSLSFPRKLLIDSDGYEVKGIPIKLKQAVCDVALQSANGAELWQTKDENGNIASVNIGGSVAVSYFQGSKENGKTIFESANNKLRGLFHDEQKDKIVNSQVRR